MSVARPTIYYIQGSPYARRALIAMREKGIAFHDKPMSFAELKDPNGPVAKINPRMQSPSFVDENGIAVNESLAILQYLEHTRPDTPPLMPTEKAALGLALQRLHEANAFQVRGQVFINNVVGFAMVGFEKFDRATEAGEKAYRTMLRSLAQDLLVWEGHLAAAGEGGFAGGSAFTLADCVLAPPLFFVERCGGDFSGLPALSGYMRRLAERPSVQETVPENWKAPPGGVWATIFEDVAAAVAAEKEGAGGAAE